MNIICQAERLILAVLNYRRALLMATGRSFAEFVKDKCYNDLYQTAEDYVNENWESMNLYT